MGMKNDTVGMKKADAKKWFMAGLDASDEYCDWLDALCHTAETKEEWDAAHDEIFEKVWKNRKIYISEHP